MTAIKIRVVIDENEDDEIIIKSSKMTDEVIRLQKLLSDASGTTQEIALESDEKEYFIPISEIIFFETSDSKIVAHTKTKMFRCQYRLFELEKMLPYSFIKASKSCIVNTSHVSTVQKSLTGASEVHFKGTDKKIYVSRMYYKTFRERIEETRL